MTPRKTALDGQPGAVPEIRPGPDSVSFHLAIVGVRRSAQLILRCDTNGELWVSIDTAEDLRFGDRQTID